MLKVSHWSKRTDLVSVLIRDLGWAEFRYQSDVIIGYPRRWNFSSGDRMSPFRNLLLGHLYHFVIGYVFKLAFLIFNIFFQSVKHFRLVVHFRSVVHFWSVVNFQHLLETSNHLPGSGVMNYSIRQPVGVAGTVLGV